MKPNRIIYTALLSGIASILVLEPAIASSSGGLPWETPLEKLKDSITGPVAGIVALVAVATAGLMLVFGGELSDFTKRLVYLVGVLGLLLGAGTLLGGLGLTSGASLAQAPDHTNIVYQIYG